MTPSGAAKVALAALVLLGWLALLSGTGTLWAGAATAAAFLGLGLWKPRVALGALVAFAASTPILSSMAGVPWFSPAEGALLALWVAVTLRERAAPRRPWDLAGTLVLTFGLYVLLATAALVLRYRYPSLGLGLSLLSHPLGDLLQLRQALPFYGLRGGTLLLEGMLAFQLARRVDAEPGAGRATLWGLWAGGCAAAASYFIYYLPRLLEPAKNWLSYRPALTLHDPNSAASFGLLVLGAGLAMATRRRRLWPVFLLPGLFVLLLGGSRTAILIALVGTLGVVAAVVRARVLARGRAFAEGDLAAAPALAPALVVLVVLGAATAFLAVRNDHFRRFATGEAFTADSFAGRLGLWEAGLRMVAQNPISGVGAGEFPLVLPRYQGAGEVPPQLAHENAHCYPLQLAAEYGLPVLVLWAMLLWALLAPRVRQWRVLSPESAGLLVGTLFYLMHSLQSHPLLLPEQQVLFWAALGGLAGHFSKLQEPQGPSGARWVAALCLLAPLWSLTQPLPAAEEAWRYGFYPPHASEGGETRAWTGPEAWLLFRGDAPVELLASAVRPDVGPPPAQRSVTLRAGLGAAAGSCRVEAPELLGVTASPAQGVPGFLLHLSVDPALVPSDLGLSPDRRALGVRLLLPARPLPPGQDRGAGTATVAVRTVPTPDIAPEDRSASFDLRGVPARLAPGEAASVTARFRRGGENVWPCALLADSPRPLHAACRWLREGGEESPPGGARVPLYQDVPPGGVAEVRLDIRAPEAPGRYRLVADLVQEQVAWFGCSGEAVEVLVAP